MIYSEELTKIYKGGLKKRGIVALDRVSLSIQAGEIFGLLGPNGAGKTTFLKIILGLTKSTSGRVEIAGFRPDDARSRLRVGYLPENHSFPSYLSGIEMIRLSGKMCGLGSSEISDRIPSLLQQVGMERWGTTKLRKYSKGMLQRIGIAQALINNPDIVLLDEPTDGVDPVGRVEIRDVLKKIKEEGKLIVLNSHLLSEVEAVADRVAILQRGRVVKINTVDELTIRGTQFEINADIGNKLIEVPEEIGKKLNMSTTKLVVELREESQINFIIDDLRMKKINIRSIVPIRLTLEQSFMEAVSDSPTTPGGEVTP